MVHHPLAALGCIKSVIPLSHACVHCFAPGVIAQPALPQMTAAASLAVVASALEAHVREAARRGWAQPEQLPRGEPAAMQACAAPASSPAPPCP